MPVGIYKHKKHTKATKNKIRKSMKGKKWDWEWKARLKKDVKGVGKVG